MKRRITICTVAMFVLLRPYVALTGQIEVTVTDMTPTAALEKPLPLEYQPRYISGFGSGDSFTLFFEDRARDFQVCYLETSHGINGFPESATPTNVRDTHFCVKAWPITVEGTDYAYRAWGALWNTPDHHFYVSNDLKNWTLVSTFRIPNSGSCPGGTVYYGFHDVICLNGTYYAWGECNIGHTLVCRSANGDDQWQAFDRVGGFFAGPLQLPDVGTPTGCFFELGGDRGYGKIMVPGNNSAFYLAVNTAAKPSLPPAELEAAFINPNNWTWHDGTTGLPGTPILEVTAEHDLRECWLVPGGGTEWTLIYDADFGAADGGKCLGYAALSIPLANTPPLADAGPDQTIEQESYAGTVVTLDGSGSTDPDSTPGTNNDIEFFDWYEGATYLGSGETLDDTFPLGRHTVTLVVTDYFGETDDDEVIITVVDTTPPELACSVTPEGLWPPNHRMVPVIVSIEALDICTETDGLTLFVTAQSSEPDDDKGDGAFTGDVDGEDGFTSPVDVSYAFAPDIGGFVGVVDLRAERDAPGINRIYTITATLTDLSGNSTVAGCDVVVPYDQGKAKKK